MTPEMVEYHRAMLLVGLGDRFYRAFDEALEQENPLSDLTLSLSTCISDKNEVLHILKEYTMDHPFDEQQVCELILDEIRSRYVAGELSRAEVADVLYRIVWAVDRFWDEPWHSLTDLSYDLELLEENIITEEVFNQCFDSWLLRGKPLSAWALREKAGK